MASKQLTQNALKCAVSTSGKVLATVPRTSFVQARFIVRSSPITNRYLHTSRNLLANSPTSAAAESIVTPKPEPPPPQADPEPAKHAAFLGEADSDDGFEAFKDAHGDPPPALDATNAAFLGEADSDDGFESRKDVDGEKLEAIDATNAAYLGEADSDDGFVAHREAHPEEGDFKIINPEESGLHGQPGEQDQ